MSSNKNKERGGIRKIFGRILSLVTAFSVVCTLLSCSIDNKNAVRLTWVVPGERSDDFDVIEAKINEITEKRLGVGVKFIFIDADGYYGNRINAKIEAGEKIDLCFTGYLDSYRARVENDKLMVLNELLEYAPRLKSEIPDYLWDGAKINDKIYAVPNQQIAAASAALVVSKPLADKYGFDVSSVKKTEDIEPFLKLLSENEPDVYPARINWGINGVRTLESNSFDEMSYGGVYIINDGGKIKTELITESEDKKNAAKLLHEWYENGYVRNDIAVAVDSADELAAGKYGIWFETYKPGVEYQRKLMTGNDVYAVQISKPYINSGGTQSAMTGICSSSGHPTEAIKLLEIVNTEPEILNLLTYGIEGKNYDKLSDNVIKRRSDTFYNPTWFFGNQFIVYTEQEQDNDIWEKTKNINENAIKSPIVGFSADLSMLLSELTRCNEVLANYEVLNNGVENPDSYWDSLDSELRSAGAEKIKQELENQINKFLGQKIN